MIERETEIIEGLKGNDEWVFERVFEEYFPRMQHFATSLVGDKEEARDIVNRVFMVFWSMRAKFNTLNNIQAFLYITTRNNCFDYLKYQKRQERKKKAYETRLNEEPEEKTAEMRMLETELMQLIHQKIEDLPKKCREVFKLTYFEGLQAGEIARRLNISTSAVTSHRHNAIKYIKAVLAEEDFLVFLLLIGEGLRHIPHTA